MTRARALKTIIRARAAKTGERYTTARRHVLNDLRARSSETVTPFPAAKKPVPPAAEDAKKKTAAKPAAARGGLSDAKAREKTGHGLDHWFDIFDRFGGVEKGHTALARHLYEAHGVDGWYSQGITVAYERARGARAANQRCDGEFEVSASKVVKGKPADVFKAITDKRARARWTGGVDAHLVKALSSALDSPASKGVVVRADGLGRYRYKWGETTVQLYLVPKEGGKTSFVATNSKLGSASMVEERRAMWRAALNALAVYLAARD
jgi:uncharacterized protein YndB with AHSA1/START domain